MARKPVLAFVHIPRTGGGSALLRDREELLPPAPPSKSPGNYQRRPEKTRQGLEQIAKNPGQWQAVSDHVPYGPFRRYLPTRAPLHPRSSVIRWTGFSPTTTSTLRPLATPRPGSAGERKLRNTWETLLNNERLKRDGARGRGRDRARSGSRILARGGVAPEDRHLRQLHDALSLGGESLYGELPPDAVEKAKENLSTFWFVAFRERLDDSIVLLGRKLGVGLMPYYLRHVSQKRPPLADVSDELRGSDRRA